MPFGGAALNTCFMGPTFEDLSQKGLALRYMSDIEDKVSGRVLQDLSGLETGDRRRNCLRAFRNSVSHMCGILSPSQCGLAPPSPETLWNNPAPALEWIHLRTAPALRLAQPIHSRGLEPLQHQPDKLG